MQPEERDLITGLFGRLQQFESQPREPEAERLIANLVVRQPSTPYLLTQTVLVQEQALKAAQERIAELEAKTAAAAAPSGFLSSAPKIGPWGASPAARPAAPPPPPTAQPPGQPAGGGGGFLRTALTTAAGVAGGALLFEGIRNMMGHNPGPFGGSQGLAGTPQQQVPQPPDGQQALLDDGATSDDYDLTSDNSGFDGGGSDDSSV